MDMYRDGYERYCSACEEFGLESKDFYFFINNLTEEQLNAYKEHSKRSEQINAWCRRESHIKPLLIKLLIGRGFIEFTSLFVWKVKKSFTCLVDYEILNKMTIT